MDMLSGAMDAAGGDMLAKAAAMAKEKIMDEIKPKIVDAIWGLIPGYLSCCCMPCDLCCENQGKIEFGLSLASAPKDILMCKCINPALVLCDLPNPVEGLCISIFGEDGPPSPCFCFQYIAECCFPEDCINLAGKFPDVMAGGGKLEMADLQALLAICVAAAGAAAAAAAVEEPTSTAGAPADHWVWAQKRQAGDSKGKLQKRYFKLNNGVIAYFEKEDGKAKKDFDLKGYTVSVEENAVHVVGGVQNVEIEFHSAENADWEKALSDFVAACEAHIKFADSKV